MVMMSQAMQAPFFKLASTVFDCFEVTKAKTVSATSLRTTLKFGNASVFEGNSVGVSNLQARYLRAF